MKTGRFPGTWLGLALAAGLAGSFALSAADPQPGSDRGGNRGGPPNSGDRGGFFNRDRGGPPGNDRGGATSNDRGGGFMLDDQQRHVLREANANQNQALQNLEAKLRDAQKELMAAVLAEKFEEAEVKAKAEAVAKIQTEMLMLRAKVLATVAPTLKLDQRDSLENSRMGPMMLSGGFDWLRGPDNNSSWRR